MINKIIIHWTAGRYVPNNTEFEHYHYLITDKGLLVAGKHTPRDNENCTDGNYAAHCGGGNTGAIGIALCGMAGYVSGKPKSTKYPLKASQCEACWKQVAILCKRFGIPVTAKNVMTHYEFGQAHPKTTSYGKIDITYLSPYPKIKKEDIGDYIRGKVIWYLKHV